MNEERVEEILDRLEGELSDEEWDEIETIRINEVNVYL